VTLYQMATGQLPFYGDTSAVLLLALIQETPVAPVRLNLNTEIQEKWNPTTRAAIELQRGNFEGAVKFLQPLERFEIYTPYISYLRGRAYLGLKAGNEAAVEFQKVIDRPGLYPLSVSRALAHLGLARAYALAGDSPKAKTAYQDFFAIWRDADADDPILKQARTEYGKLQ